VFEQFIFVMFVIKKMMNRLLSIFELSKLKNISFFKQIVLIL